MYFIWGIVLFHFLLSLLLKDHINNNTYITLSLILITSVILFVVLVKHYTRFLFVIFSSFILRIIILCIDVFYNELNLIPHSGDDTENYYNTGIIISNNITMLSETVYGGIYSKILGIIFLFYGDDRLFVQFLNIFITLTAILIVIKILRSLKVSKKFQTIAVVSMSFFPHSLIFSAVLLRESLISLLVVLSLYYFVRWYQNNSGLNAILSIVFIFIGASLHSAVLAVSLGYFFAFIFYKRFSHKFKFTVYSVVPFVILGTILSYFLIFPESTSSIPFLNKFQQVLNNNESIYDIFSGGRAGSAYLVGLEINNILELIIYAPIKMIYFLASPMPWSIRGLNDLISFAFDAVFYIISVIIVIKNFKIIKKNPLLVILIISFTAGCFIFGVSISNTGTALRHRFKLFYILVLIISLMGSYKKEHKNFDEKIDSTIKD